MPDQNNQLAPLISQLNDAITAFNAEKVDLVEKDRAQGGDGHAVFDALDLLRRARSKLIQQALDFTQPGFGQLANDAKAATEALNRSIEELEAVSKILGKVDQVISLVGKILIAFGV